MEKKFQLLKKTNKRVLSFLVNEVKSVYHFNTIVNNSETE